MEHADTFPLILTLGLGMGAQWLAWRFKLPAIIVLILAGLAAGPITGALNPSADLGELLRPLIQVGVALILFDGGLSLRFHELRRAGAGIGRLIVVGAPLAFGLGTLVAHYLGALDWPVAAVFGAITVVTGPTVIIPLLRQAKLDPKVGSTLKWEGIVNDPIGALLAVLIFEFVISTGSDQPLVLHAGAAVLSVLVAIGIGLAIGFAIVHAFRAGWAPEYLKVPVVFAAVVVAFGLANEVQAEAGLLATTVLGLVIGNSNLPSIEEIRRFKEALAVIVVSAVFILLTADLDLVLLTSLGVNDLAVLLFIIFLVRPLVTVVATIRSGMSVNEKILVGWVAPRGIVAAAVAGAFAEPLIAAGHQDAERLVPLVFALILATVVLHGLSLSWLARRLGLAAKGQHGLLIVGASPWSIALAKVLIDIRVKVTLADMSWHRLRPARLQGLPVYYGQIASDAAEASLDTGDTGYLLAATDNDAYNALICTRFAAALGRNHTYQLPMPDADDDPRGLPTSLRGRTVFGPDAQYEELLRRLFQGWQFQKTRLTHAFTHEDLAGELGEDAIPLLRRRPSGELVFCRRPEDFEGAAEDILVSFIPPRAREREGRREEGRGRPGEG